MAIESHVVIPGSVSGSRQNFTYDFYFGGEIVYSVKKLLPIGFDTDADALSMYAQVWEFLQEQEMSEAYEKANNRQNPDLVPSVYNSQVDFDRKLLGYVMTIEDPHKLNSCLPFWQAVQPRNGNNTAQRIANLGVPETEYDEIAARFNGYFGVATFLTDDLAAIWSEVKEAWV